MKKYLAIVNPIAGVKEKETAMKLLARAFSGEDERLYFTFTSEYTSAFTLAKEAITKGYEALIAIGGDGTINEVAAALYNSPLKLGIIPKGSGNGMARALGIPIDDDEAAVEVIRRAHVRAIDTSFANGSPFFCTFGVGFDAGLTHRYSEIASRGLFSYLKSAIDEYIGFKPKMYKITAGGTTFSCEAMLVTCANIDQYGSNAFIAPGASPDDGLLDLVIVSPISLLRVPQLVVQLFTKRISHNTQVESLRCADITIEREEEGIVQVDGESLEMGKSIAIKVIPRSLQVYVPEERYEE